jgi:predicted dehydrogenase
MSDKPLRIGLVGAGSRGVLYTRYAVKLSDKVKICAIAEPNEYRRNPVSEEFGIP